MLFPGSRYQHQPTDAIVLADGSVVRAVRLPLVSSAPLIGFHQRHQGERLDLIASHYLGDATATWRLCDANNAIVPDALAGHSLIGVPARGT